MWSFLVIGCYSPHFVVGSVDPRLQEDFELLIERFNRAGCEGLLQFSPGVKASVKVMASTPEAVGYYAHPDLLVSEDVLWDSNLRRGVLAHELGHALGLQHTEYEGIMSERQNYTCFNREHSCIIEELRLQLHFSCVIN